jgi:GGDEF domain-containing protein
MSVISMKRLLGAEAQGPSHPLRVAQILVRGIGLHAVEGEPSEFRGFRTAMDQFAESLGEAVTEASALVTASDTLRALERHNRSAENYLHAGGNDLRAMVKMLTAAIGEFSSAGDENVKNLRQIESSIASASQSQDVRAIRAHLATCLMEIRKETERQKAATRSVVDRLQEELECARTESIDPATGLPPRAKAVEWIYETCKSRTPAFAACLTIDCLQRVNATYGSEIGDQIIRYFAGQLQRNLPEGDRLFRWTGACLLAVAPRSGSLQTVTGEFGRMMERKLEYTVQTATRSVLLPINARWAVYAFMPSAQELIGQIDGFASAGGAA